MKEREFDKDQNNVPQEVTTVRNTDAKGYKTLSVLSVGKREKGTKTIQETTVVAAKATNSRNTRPWSPPPVHITISSFSNSPITAHVGSKVRACMRGPRVGEKEA